MITICFHFILLFFFILLFSFCCFASIKGEFTLLLVWPVVIDVIIYHLSLQNDKGQVPGEVVPDPMDMTLDKAEAAMAAKELKQLLLDAVPLSCNLPRATLPNYDNIPGNLMLTSLGLKLGERVMLDDMKVRGSMTLRDVSPSQVLNIERKNILLEF